MGAASALADTERNIPAWIAPAFISSGFSALIYQVVWQRVLFAGFGINVEAVTVVVTAFLVGLGLGSLLGGEVSKNPHRPVLLWFAGLELCVAVYGFVSVPFFRYVAGFAAAFSPVMTGLVTFALVLAPTLFMGATLPLLVAYSVRVSGNVGRSVGWLYFVNTAGSAMAAIAAALILMGRLGETGSVRAAAMINASVGAFVLLQHVRLRANA